MTELEILNQKVGEAKVRVEAVLKQHYGANRTLDYLSINDRRSLYNMFVWEQRYHLKMEVILDVLFNHYDQFRQREKKKSKMGLPIRVSTLLGQISQEVLKAYINDTYPNQEQTIRMLRQESMLKAKLEEDNLLHKIKPVTDYQDLETYTKDYSTKIEQNFFQMQNLRMQLKSSTRPYRSNPWR